MNEPVIHNPVNVEMLDLRYRFCYKGETRRLATHMWNPANAAWQEMGSSFDGPLNPDFTYRTYKYLPYTPLFETVKPAGGPPPEAVAHGAPLPTASGTPIPRGTRIEQGPARIYIDENDFQNVLQNVHNAKPLTPEVAAQMTAPDKVDTTLDERGERYGTFAENAAIAQRLKQVLAQALVNKTVEPYVAEALDMFCSKISRIVTGDPAYPDNWLDLEGFARLVRLNLEGTTR